MIIDTCFLVALRNGQDENHQKAKELMKEMLKGKYGNIIVTDYVYDETMTLIMIRTMKKELIKDIEDYIFKSKKIKFLYMNEKQLQEPKELFKKYFEHKLSFTDCSLVALQKILNTPSFIATFKETLKNLANIVPGL